jgi:hypothetical protein|tara:strand:- start:380 stop:1249 length:870 start_codon:yes stop_codon:yes gene_type:complete
MKKFKILIPVYNDWQSLIKLLDEIGNSVEHIKNAKFDCLVINDASTIKLPKIQKPANLNSIKIINMIKNQGHARCNAFGLRYTLQEDFDYLILMDGDGEDRPEEIKTIIEKVFNEDDISVVAKRVKRSEGPMFQFLYRMHKVITYVFTGKKINFGNYSCLTNKDVKILSDKASIWSSFSGSVKKHIYKLNEIDSVRGIRYFGPSKMSLFKLGIHSFAIIAVFKSIVFLRSAIFLIILSNLNSFLGTYTLFIQIALVVFNLLIYVVSLREDKKSLKKSHLNKKDVLVITH